MSGLLRLHAIFPITSFVIWTHWMRLAWPRPRNTCTRNYWISPLSSRRNKFSHFPLSPPSETHTHTRTHIQWERLKRGLSTRAYTFIENVIYFGRHISPLDHRQSQEVSFRWFFFFSGLGYFPSGYSGVSFAAKKTQKWHLKWFSREYSASDELAGYCLI